MTIQELLRIVPEGETLSAEVLVSNQDVGFLHTGQRVTVKIEQLPLIYRFRRPDTKHDEDIRRILLWFFSGTGREERRL